MPNLGSQGIAIAKESECSNGQKSFFWVEDGATDEPGASSHLRSDAGRERNERSRRVVQAG
jgi:hypothetical protein